MNPANQRQPLDANIERVINNDQSAHNAALSTSVAGVLNKLAEKYKISDRESANSVIGQFKISATNLYSNKPVSRQKFEQAFRYIVNKANESLNQLDNATVSGEARTYPLALVFPIVCAAILDKSAYRCPYGRTEEQELNARIDTLSQCLIHLAESPPCHTGIRNDLVMTLNGVYPGVDIIEDLRSYLNALVTEYFETQLGEIKKTDPKKYYKLLTIWINPNSSKEDDNFKEAYINIIKESCKQYLIKKCVEQGLTEDKEGTKLLRETETKIDDVIGAVGYLNPPIGSDPLLHAVSKIFNPSPIHTFGGISEELKSYIQIRNDVIVQLRNSLLEAGIEHFASVDRDKEKLLRFVPLDELFLEMYKNLQLYKDLPEVSMSINVALRELTEKAYKNIGENVEDFIQRIRDKLKELSQGTFIKSIDKLLSTLENLDQEKREDFVKTWIKKLPRGYLLTIINSMEDFVKITSLISQDSVAYIVPIWIRGSSAEYLRKIIRSLEDLVSICGFIHDKTLLNNFIVFYLFSGRDAPANLSSIILSLDDLQTIIDLLDQKSAEKIIVSFIDKVTPEHLSEIILSLSDLCYVIDFLEHVEREAFIITWFNKVTTEYLQRIIISSKDLEEVLFAIPSKAVKKELIEIWIKKCTPQYLQTAITEPADFYDLLDKIYDEQAKGKFITIWIEKATPEHLQKVIEDYDDFMLLLEKIPDVVEPDERGKFIATWIEKSTPEHLQKITENGGKFSSMFEKIFSRVAQEKFVTIWLQKVMPECLQRLVKSKEHFSYMLNFIPVSMHKDSINIWLQKSTPEYLQGFIQSKEQFSDMLNLIPESMHENFIGTLFQGLNKDDKYVQKVMTPAFEWDGTRAYKKVDRVVTLNESSGLRSPEQMNPLEFLNVLGSGGSSSQKRKADSQQEPDKKAKIDKEETPPDDENRLKM